MLPTILARETGVPASKCAADIAIALRTHSGLTVEQFLTGVRDARGHLLPRGYIGWFWFQSKTDREYSTLLPAAVKRVCLELQCSEQTLLEDIAERVKA